MLSWPRNPPSTDGNYSSVIKAMKQLQQNHLLLLWAPPEGVSVLPVRAVPCGSQRVTLGWRPEIWRGLGAAWHSSSTGVCSGSVDYLCGTPGTCWFRIPRVQGGGTNHWTQPELTQRQRPVPAPAASGHWYRGSLTPAFLLRQQRKNQRTHPCRGQRAAGCQVTVSQKIKSLIRRGLSLTMSLGQCKE